MSTASNAQPDIVATASSAPALGPESRDKEARMRAMLDAAVALFSEEGYAAVSTRRIAEVAGCSETLLFRYFGGKRGLLLAICNELTHDPGRRPDPRATGSLREYLEQYFEFILDTLGSQAPRMKIVAAAIVSDPEMSADFESRHDADVASVASQLQVFQDMGTIAPDIDIVASAAAIQQATFAIGLLMQIVYGKPRAELKAVARAFARAFSTGMEGKAETPLAEPLRRDVLTATTAATEQLDRIMSLLTDTAAANDAAPSKGTARRKTAKPRS